jgi:hypothetical protein
MHDQSKRGQQKPCPRCNGTGWVTEWDTEPEATSTAAPAIPDMERRVTLGRPEDGLGIAVGGDAEHVRILMANRRFQAGQLVLRHARADWLRAALKYAMGTRKSPPRPPHEQ